MKVKLLFDVMEKGVQKLKRGLRWFSNMVGLMNKGDVSALLRGSEKKSHVTHPVTQEREDLFRRLASLRG